MKKTIFLYIILISAFSNLFAGADKPYTYGHISSFFKQSERPSPIVDYRTKEHNQLDIEKVYPNLLKLDTNYFAIGLWAAEDRSIYSWKNFITLASKLQQDKPDISLVVYVRSPDYGKNKHFCWDENISSDTCTNEADYNDYILWAEKVARLHARFPIIKGILIDDFLYTISHDDSDGRVLSPDYLAQIRSKGQNFYSDFTIDAVFYQKIISAYHAKRFENSLDGVLFFYRHFDTNGTRLDPNPNRVKEEIEMFYRCYTPHVSPVATIYRKPTKSSTKDDILELQGKIDISSITTDIDIVYWDNIYDPSVKGLTKIKLYLNDEIILEQDMADGISDNSLQILTIPYTKIRNTSSNSATIKMEIISTKSYWRWSYLVNLFILKPENIPVQWNIVHDDDGAHVLTTNNDLQGSTKKYLGIYGGTHSQFDVTTSYTKTLLRYAHQAIRSKKLDGLIAWEVMMNKPSSGIFKAFNDDSTPSSLFVRKIDNGKLFAFYLDDNGKYLSNKYIGSFKSFEYIASADFDNNGATDILFRIGNGTIYHILLNNDGSIKDFSKIATMNASWSVENIISDLNGDGNPDLLVREMQSKDLYILYLDSEGKYLGNKALRGFREWKIKGSGDFDNNGINDLLISNDQGTISRVLFNNDGSVKDASVIATMSSNWELENQIGDFNGDNIDDILVRKKNDGKVYVFYLNDQGKYNGNRFIGNMSGWKIKGIGDFDTNGISDIVLYRPADGMMARVLMDKNGSIKNASKIASMSSDWKLEPF